MDYTQSKAPTETSDGLGGFALLVLTCSACFWYLSMASFS